MWKSPHDEFREWVESHPKFLPMDRIIYTYACRGDSRSSEYRWKKISFGFVTMRRSQIPPEKLGLAKRDANRTWPASRIVNSWLPAIQAGPKTLRSFSRPRKTTFSNKDEPFNYHSLLKEVGNGEAEAQHLLEPSNAPHANRKVSDGTTAIGNEKERCAGCIRLSESQRQTAANVQVARNVIESLEASVWPAPGSEDTKFGVTMGPEVGHGEAEVYAGVQA